MDVFLGFLTGIGLMLFVYVVAGNMRLKNDKEVNGRRDGDNGR